MSDALKFNQGDRVIVTSGTGWGPTRFRVAQVTKVHKTGHFLLNFGDDKWRQDGSKVGPRSRFQRNDYAEPYCSDRLAELESARDNEASRMNLNKLGDLLTRERDDEKGAALWRSLPQELRDMVAEQNGTGTRK